jgi:hypothetical protein
MTLIEPVGMANVYVCVVKAERQEARVRPRRLQRQLAVVIDDSYRALVGDSRRVVRS